jgi:glycosyltransferase involved in cell wall biosynthesis
LAVSRNTLGYWGNKAPRNPLFLVPNALDQAWLNRGDRSARHRRPIDVLVQARKSSPYVLKQLVPALRQAGLEVEVQTGWVDDLVDLFNRSTVYLYDSAEYWRGRGVTEGFGLPPLEALACGCVVFSSLNHALADYGDPGQTVHQIGCGRLRFDLERIKAAIAAPQRWRPADDRLKALLQECSETALLDRWRNAFAQLDTLEAVSGPPLTSPPAWRLQLQQRLVRLQRVVNRLPGWPKG